MPGKSDDTFERQIKLASLYWDEFKYRHALYWSLVSKSVLVHTFLISASVFPSSAPQSLWVSVTFCLIAILFTLLSFRVLLAEGSRMLGPANLHRELILHHTPSNLHSQYLINLFPRDSFRIGGRELTAAFPILSWIPFMWVGTDTRTISMARISQLAPFIWRAYGVTAPLIVLVSLLISSDLTLPFTISDFCPS